LSTFSNTLFLQGFQVVALVGFGLLAGTATPHIQYVGVVFAAIGE